ncbi:UNVERIFIED_CONTAM: hypothetical protein FKN15_066497 [Acipenser sinensis]
MENRFCQNPYASQALLGCLEDQGRCLACEEFGQGGMLPPPIREGKTACPKNRRRSWI